MYYYCTYFDQYRLNLCWGACQEGVWLDPHFHCNCTPPRGELPRLLDRLLRQVSFPLESFLILVARKKSAG